MIVNERNSLIRVIGQDICAYGKLPLLLLILCIVSALAVVYTTHNTRLLTEQREQIILERNKLNVEWRNLILEEYVLGEHSRISEVATSRLNMNYVEQGKELIVIK